MLQLIKRPRKYNHNLKLRKRQYLKMQTMNFKERALYELQLEKARKGQQQKPVKKYYWVRVLFSNGQTKMYQCSRDLQQVCQRARPQNRMQSYFNGYLINVPVTKYHKGKATIDTALIIETWLKPDHTHDCNKITRSQILWPQLHKTFFGLFNDRNEMYNFLKHDYDQKSQQRIKESIYSFIPLRGYIKSEYQDIIDQRVLDKC